MTTLIVSPFPSSSYIHISPSHPFLSLSLYPFLYINSSPSRSAVRRNQRDHIVKSLNIREERSEEWIVSRAAVIGYVSRMRERDWRCFRQHHISPSFVTLHQLILEQLHWAPILSHIQCHPLQYLSWRLETNKQAFSGFWPDIIIHMCRVLWDTNFSSLEK